MRCKYKHKFISLAIFNVFFRRKLLAVSIDCPRIMSGSLTGDKRIVHFLDFIPCKSSSRIKIFLVSKYKEIGKENFLFVKLHFDILLFYLAINLL